MISFFVFFKKKYAIYLSPLIYKQVESTLNLVTLLFVGEPLPYLLFLVRKIAMIGVRQLIIFHRPSGIFILPLR